MNRILTPQEIEEQKGNLIDEIIRLSDFSFERMPMLDIIGERLAENIAVAVPDLVRVNSEASLSALDYTPLAQVMESLPSPAIYAVCGGEPLEGEFLLVMDSTMLMAGLELMLGGEAKQLVPRETGDFTAIERGFGEKLAKLILEELERSFSVVTDSRFDLSAIETEIDALNVAQPASLCVRMKISVAMAGHTGEMDVILPYDALEPIRGVLGKIHFGERNDGGSVWRDQLSSQIERAHLELEAVFAEIEVPIQTIMDWSKGTTIDLFVEDGHEATITCANVPMFRAVLGKRNNGAAALQITEELEHEEEAENGRNNH
jgi:flagellar motor switch protein FliM